MIGVEQAIRRVNRSLILVWGIHLALAAAVLLAMLAGTMLGVSPILLAAIPCTLWILLAMNGVRETRNAMQWPALISAGRFDEAEAQIEKSILGFSVLRSVKLLSLHQLAVVRMSRRQWLDALQLSRAIIGYRLPKDQSLQRASLLVLAGAAVQSGMFHDAYAAIGRLRTMPLSLDEQLSLLLSEAMYCGKTGAWKSLTHAIADKAKMAELMPGDVSARTQAWLALGASRCGYAQWTDYLKERCELLADPGKLCEEEPAFKELWPNAGGTHQQGSDGIYASAK